MQEGHVMNDQVKREPRIVYAPLNRVFLNIKGSLKKIVNISTSGLALKVSEFEETFKPGDQIIGEICFDGGENLRLDLEVVHTANETIGLKVNNMQQSFFIVVSTYFFREISAQKMKPVRFTNTKQGPSGETH